MADAGVLWLQLTGGEPLIDPLFAETHTTAWDMGMMIQISSNGSRLVGLLSFPDLRAVLRGSV
jgi:organic radical activating enzyme